METRPPAPQPSVSFTPDRWLLIPACKSVFTICKANLFVSKSSEATTIISSTRPERFCNTAYCSFVMARRLACVSNSMRALDSSSALCRANAARSFALAALSSAIPNFLLDRSRSSVWMPLAYIPNNTSPIIPIPIPASGQMDNLMKVSYGGSINAISSSTTTQNITKTPNEIDQCSHEDPASSNSVSDAYFFPFIRYHAGKGRVRTVLLAIALWSLVWGAIFAVWWHLGYFQR